jgi:hypothetical protein
VFLAEMERVVPWSALCGLIEPFYPGFSGWPASEGRSCVVAPVAASL